MQADARMEAVAGPVRYVLQVPALGQKDYARLQAVLLRGTMPRPGWRGRLGGLVVGCIVGGSLGFLVAVWDVTAELWVASAQKGWLLSLDGFGILLVILGLILATMLALGVILASRQRRAIHALHAAGGALFGAHELLLGDDGVVWRNASRTLFVPWSRVTGAVRRGGMLFLLADRVSAFWLPESLIAAHPDRAGLEVLLQHSTAVP